MGFDSDCCGHSLPGPEECLESSSKEPQKKTYGEQVTLSKFAGPPSMKIDTQCLMELQNGEVLSPRDAQHCIHKFPVSSALSPPLSPASKSRPGQLDIAAHEPNVISSVVTTLHCIDFEGELWNELLARNEDIVRQAVIQDINSVLRFFPAEAAVKIMPMYTGFVAHCQVTHIIDISQDYINQCLSTFHFPVTRKLYQDLLLDCKLHALPAHARSISAVESEPASLCESAIYGSQQSLISPDNCLSPFGERMTSPEEEGREATRSANVLPHVLLPRRPSASQRVSLCETAPMIERITLIRSAHELRDPARSMSAVEAEPASVREAALFGAERSFVSTDEYPAAAKERLTATEEESETARRADGPPGMLLPMSPDAPRRVSYYEMAPVMDRSVCARSVHELRDPARSMSAVVSEPASVREAALFGAERSFVSTDEYPAAAKERLTATEEESETARRADGPPGMLLPMSPDAPRKVSFYEMAPVMDRSVRARSAHELRDPARSMSAVEAEPASVREAALFGAERSFVSTDEYPAAAKERLSAKEEESETARRADGPPGMLLPMSPDAPHKVSYYEMAPVMDRSVCARSVHELRDPARSMSAVVSEPASVLEAALFGADHSLLSADQCLSPFGVRPTLTEEGRESARYVVVLPRVLLPMSPDAPRKVSFYEMAPVMDRSVRARSVHELRDPARSMSAVEAEPASVREAALFGAERSFVSTDEYPAAAKERLSAKEEESETARRADGPPGMLLPMSPDAPRKVSFYEMAPVMDRSVRARSVHELRDPARSMSAVEAEPASVREAVLFGAERSFVSTDEYPAAAKERLSAKEEESETARRADGPPGMLLPMSPDAPRKVSFYEMAPVMDRSVRARSVHELRDPARSMSAVEAEPASVREAVLFGAERSFVSTDEYPAAAKERLSAKEEESETARRADGPPGMLLPMSPDAPRKVSFYEMAPVMDRSVRARSVHELRDPARSMSAVEAEPASVREAVLFGAERSFVSTDEYPAAAKERLSAKEEESETARRADGPPGMLLPMSPDAPRRVSYYEMAPVMDRSVRARSAHELRDPARSMSAVEAEPASVREAALFGAERSFVSTDEYPAAAKERLTATEEESETARRADGPPGMLLPMSPDAPRSVSFYEMAPVMDRSVRARSVHELRDPARSMSAVVSEPASVREAVLFDADRSLTTADQCPAVAREGLTATEEESETARRADGPPGMLLPMSPDAPRSVSFYEMAPVMDRSVRARSVHELRDPARSMSAVVSEPASVREAVLFGAERSFVSTDEYPAAAKERLSAKEEESETARRADGPPGMLLPMSPDAPRSVSFYEMAPVMDRSVRARSVHELRDPARSMSAVEAEPASVREAVLFGAERSFVSTDEYPAAAKERLSAKEEESETARRADGPPGMLLPMSPDAPRRVSYYEMAPVMDRSVRARSAHELRDPARSMSAVEAEPASVREAALFGAERSFVSTDEYPAAAKERLTATEEESETARRADGPPGMLLPMSPDAPRRVSYYEMAPVMDRSVRARSVHELRDPARSMSAVVSEPASVREAVLFDADRSLTTADQCPAVAREGLTATEEESETARRADGPPGMLLPMSPDAPRSVSFYEMAPVMDRSVRARSVHELRDPARSMSAVVSEPASVREAVLFGAERSFVSTDEYPAAAKERLTATEEESETARRADGPPGMLLPMSPDAPRRVSYYEMAPVMDRSVRARSVHELRDPARSMSAVVSEPASVREAVLFGAERSFVSTDEYPAAAKERLSAKEEESETARRADGPPGMLLPMSPDAPRRVSYYEMAPVMDRSVCARSVHELRDPARSMSAVVSEPASVREAVLFGAERSFVSTDEYPAAAKERLSAKEEESETARRADGPPGMLLPMSPDAPRRVSYYEMAPVMDRSVRARSVHELRDPARSMSAVVSEPASVREAVLFGAERSFVSTDEYPAAAKERLSAKEEESETARRADGPPGMLLPMSPDAPRSVSYYEMAPVMDRSVCARSVHELRDPARSMSAVVSEPASVREAVLFGAERSFVSTDEYPAAAKERLSAKEEESETARRADGPPGMLLPMSPDAPRRVSYYEMAPVMDRSVRARSAHELRDPARSMSAVEAEPASVREAALFGAERSFVSTDEYPAAAKERLTATEEESETARRADGPPGMLLPMSPDAPRRVSYYEMAPVMDRSVRARSVHELRDPARSMSAVVSEPASVREAVLFDADRSLTTADQCPAVAREGLTATEEESETARRADGPPGMLLPMSPDAPRSVSFYEMAPVMDRSVRARSVHELRDPARSMSAVVSEPASVREAVLFGAERSFVSTDEYPAAAKERLSAKEEESETARRADGPPGMLLPMSPDAPRRVSYYEMAPVMDRSVCARSVHELRDPARSMSAVVSEPASVREAVLFGAERSFVSTDEYPAAAKERLSAKEEESETARRADGPPGMLLPMSPDAPRRVSYYEMAPVMDRSVRARSVHELRDPARSMSAVVSEPASVREAVLFGAERSFVSTDEYPAAAKERLSAKEEESETARRADGPPGMLLPMSPDAPRSVSYYEMAPVMDRSVCARSVHELRDPARSMSAVVSEPASVREAVLFGAERSFVSTDEYPAAAKERLSAKEEESETARRADGPPGMLLPMSPDAPRKVSFYEMAPVMDRSVRARSVHALPAHARSISAVEAEPASVREAALFGAERSFVSTDEYPAAAKERLSAKEEESETARRADGPPGMLLPMSPDAPRRVSYYEMAPVMDRSVCARSVHELRDPARSMSAVVSEPASVREAVLFGAERSFVSTDEYPAAAKERLTATEEENETARRADGPPGMLLPMSPDVPRSVSYYEMAPVMDRSVCARSAHELRDPARSMSAVEAEPASVREAALFGAERSFVSTDEYPAAAKERLSAKEEESETARRADGPPGMLLTMSPDAPHKVSFYEMAPVMDRSVCARSVHELRDPARSMSAVVSEPASVREAALFGAERSFVSTDEYPAAAKERLSAKEEESETARRADGPPGMLLTMSPDAPHKVSFYEMAPVMDRSVRARSVHELRDPARSMSAVEAEPASVREAALFGAERSFVSTDEYPAAAKERLSAKEEESETARRADGPPGMLLTMSPDAPHKVSFYEMAPVMDRSVCARSAHELRDPARSMSAVVSEPASVLEAALFGADHSLLSADQCLSPFGVRPTLTEEGRESARYVVVLPRVLLPMSPDASHKGSYYETVPGMDRSVRARYAHELRDPARSMSAVVSEPASVREAVLFDADRSLTTADQRPAATKERLSAKEEESETARRADGPPGMLLPMSPDASHKGSVLRVSAGVDGHAPLIGGGLVETGDGEGLVNDWPQSGVDGTNSDESIIASDGVRGVPSWSEALNRFVRASEVVADAAEKLVAASRRMGECAGLLRAPPGVEKEPLMSGMDKSTRDATSTSLNASPCVSPIRVDHFDSGVFPKEKIGRAGKALLSSEGNIPDNEAATRRDVSKNVASGESVRDIYPGYSPVNAAQRLESADAKLPYVEEYYPASDVHASPALQSIRSGDEQRAIESVRAVEPDKLNRGAKAHPSCTSPLPETREVTAPSKRLPLTEIKDSQPIDYVQPISDSAPGKALLSLSTVAGGSMVPDVEPDEENDLSATLDRNLLLDLPKWQPSTDVDFSVVENPTERWIAFGSFGVSNEVPRRVLRESQRGRGHIQLMENTPDLNDWAQECFDGTRVEELATREGCCSPISLDAREPHETPKSRPSQSKVRAVATVTAAREAGEAGEADEKVQHLPELVPVRAEPRKGRKPSSSTGMYDIEIFEMSVPKTSESTADGQIIEVDVVCRKSLSQLLRDLERARRALRKPVIALQGYRDKERKCIQ